MKFKKIRNSKYKIYTVFLLTLLILGNFITISYAKLNFSDEPVQNYLYESPVTEEFYKFKAEGECYIIAEVINTGFSSFTIDNKIFYEVSYGFNAIPILFSESLKIHNITLENKDHFESLTIEPLFIAVGEVEVPTDIELGHAIINFNAGGLISILLKPNFSYNELYVRLDESVLKYAYDTVNYPEIDPQIYSYFVDDGSYIRFDIEVLPDTHILQLLGNGTIEYIIMANYDWDQDELPDVYEVQKKMFIVPLNPIKPNIWGFFEKSDKERLVDPIQNDIVFEGYFSLFIPYLTENGESRAHFLRIEVHNGEFFNFEFDGDTMSLQGEKAIADYPNTPIHHTTVKIYGYGWHYIRYNYKGNYNKIEFRVNATLAIILDFPEMKDSDGDGVKNVEEIQNDMEFTGLDSDNDGLPDNYDTSPYNYLILNENRIHQFTIPTSRNKNSILTLSIKRPTIDYSTFGINRLWRGAVNVSIYPVMRLFGDKYRFDDDSPINNLDKTALFDLWGKLVPSYPVVSGYSRSIGDPLPNPSDPHNETFFVFPSISETTFGYEITFPKSHPAKNDKILDIRFDFIWLVTQYEQDTKETKILHFYNFEENIILQSFNHREVGDVSYLLGTPDSLVENQILWALTQNPNIGTASAFGVENDIIEKGIVNYLDIPEVTMSHIEKYYKDNPDREKEPEVTYISGMQYQYDILDKYQMAIDYGFDSPMYTRSDFQFFLSFYSINNVYDDEEYFIGDWQIEGDLILNYKITANFFNKNQKVATIFELPIALERKTFSEANILEITKITSGPIPISDIPYTPQQITNDKIKFEYSTYIEKIIPNEGIPIIKFDYSNDILKQKSNNRANEHELGREFFESDVTSPSKATLFYKRFSLLREDLEALYSMYHYFSTEGAQPYYSGFQWDIYREFDAFLNDYVDENGYALTSAFLGRAADAKLIDINRLEIKLSDMIEQQREVYFDERIPYKEDPYSTKFTDKWGGLSKSVRNWPSISLGRLKILVNSASEKNMNILTKGNIKGKFSNTWNRIKYSKAYNGILAGYQLLMGGIGFISGIASMMTLWAEGFKINDPYNTTVWSLRFTLGALTSIAGAFSVIQGFIMIKDFKNILIYNSLEGASKFCFYFGVFLVILMLAVEWTTFLVRLARGDITGRDVWFNVIKLGAQTIGAGIFLAAALLGSGIGAIAGIIVGILSFAFSWLTAIWNKPSLKIYKAAYELPFTTKLSIRRHGGFEVGDKINYAVNIKNNGSAPGWIRTRFRLQENEDASNGWVNSWSWEGIGIWDDDWWPWEGPYLHAPFTQGTYFSHTFSQVCEDPSINLHYSFELQFDWQRVEVIVVFPTLWRTDGPRESVTHPLNTAVLQNSISEFYEDTTELMSTKLLKQDFENAKEDYRWKDAYDAATEIMIRTQENAKTPTADFEIINKAKEDFDANYFKLQTTSLGQFIYLAYKYYSVGFRAMIPIPDMLWWSVRFLGEAVRHSLSYIFSEGILLIPKEWISDTLAELGDFYLYNQSRHELPLHTNIRTDLREVLIDIDPDTDSVDVSFNLYLEGNDRPPVDIYLTPPEGFSITPTYIKQRLHREISFTINQLDRYLIMGIYYFELRITYNGQIIYSELVPIRIKGFSDLDYIEYISPEPIEPGETFKLLDIVNSGTIPEGVVLIVDGIPESYIYKDLHPEEFMNSTQFFNLNPGAIRESLIIKPPLHHSTKPGLYEYNATAINIVDNSTFFTYEGTFEIEVVHDLDFSCINPDLLIYDYSIAEYYFEIMNLGNVPEEFVVSYIDLDFATSYLEDNIFVLDPGESAIFSILMDPFDLGTDTFTVTIASEFISREIDCSLEVIDDDTLEPYFENIIISDDCNWVNIDFRGLDELLGDDMGLSLIEIYVDGELISSYSPKPSETNFSFSLINQWIWEVTNKFYSDGQITHEIRVVIVDADDDRVGDYLTNEFYRYFEVTLDEMYDYVVWLLGEVNQYIYDNDLVALYGTVTQKLVRVQDLLADAYQLIETGQLHTGLVRNKIAEAKLEIAESKAELKALKDQVGEPYISEILSMMHNIRNKIVELMGRSVGTEFSHEISLTEVDLYDLRDLIEENINETDIESLFNIIALAASKLENAIFDISLGKDTEDSMIQALHALDHAKAEVNSLYGKGKISEVLRETLILEIMLLQEKIYQLIDF